MDSKLSQLELLKNKYFRDIGNNSYKVLYLLIDFKNKDDLVEIESYKSETDENNEYDIKYVRAVTNRIKMELISVFTDQGRLYPEIKANESNESNFQLKTEDIQIDVKINGDKNVEGNFTWELVLEGEFFILETCRNKMLKKMMRYFENMYCLLDEISREISVRSYPLINGIENKLREYLLRFFIKKVGKNWWRKNTDDALDQKSKIRGNTRDFNGILKMEIYNLDFIDLLDLINKNFEKIDENNILQSLDAIINAKDKSELVELKASKLKEKFQNNWVKFFEKYITIEQFSEKWKQLYEIRCIVSHNSLIKLKTFISLIELYELVYNKLEEIISAMGKENLSVTEKASILREKESTEYIKNILNLDSFRIGKDDINSIIERNSFILNSRNIVAHIDEEKFKEFVSMNIRQLELIAEIKKYEFQNDNKDEDEDEDEDKNEDESNLFNMCIIFFNEIPQEKLNILKSAIDSFSDSY